MAKYLAMQIKKGNLEYDKVVVRYPQFRSDIDAILNTGQEVIN